MIGAFGGSLGQAANGVIGSGNYTLNITSEDGSASSPLAGVKTLEVKLDGKLVDTITTSCPEPRGVPAEGCFGLNGSWTMNGQSVGAGPHTITVVARDWVGNESSAKSMQVTVNEAAYEPLGPGAVNLETGDFKLNPTDVSVAAGPATLSVSRVYDSRKLVSGEPLGPSWSLSLPDSEADGEWHSLTPLSNGNVALTAANGSEVVFEHSGSGYVSPAGFQTDTLSSSGGEYQLTDAQGNYTRFAQPSSGAAYLPSKVVQASSAGGLNKVTDLYTTKEGEAVPSEVIGPEPSEGACTKELVKGCRALTFEYATSTTAKEGEAESNWGEYKGRLAKIYLNAWEPSKGEMVKLAVAEYAYDDSKGRLRAEWNPQVEATTDCGKTCPPLKTTYGYSNGDPAIPYSNLVTALTPAGEESWVFTYGTTTGDANPGRVLKVRQAPASSKCETGCSTTPLTKTGEPRLSGAAEVGVRMAVSNGEWSSAPVGFGYQWKDCNTGGGECAPILGATNANYTPSSSDLGHKLVAEVTATNGGGSVAVSTSASAVVVAKPADYEQTIDSGNSLNAVSCFAAAGPECVVSDSKGNAFYATSVSATAEAAWKAWSGPSGESPSQAVECPSSSLCLLADGKEKAGGKLYYATSLGGSWSEALNPLYGVDAITCTSVSFCVDGQNGAGSFRYSTNPASTSWTGEEQGEGSVKSVSCLQTVFCASVTGNGELRVATSTSQIESSSWKETHIDTNTLDGIACLSASSCVGVDSAGDVLNIKIESNGAATATEQDIAGSVALRRR